MEAAVQTRPPWSEHEECIARALAYAASRSYSEGETIVSPEAPAEHAFYYVHAGTVEVSYRGARDTKIVVALIGAGDFFGEVGFFDQGARRRTLTATDEVELAVFDQQVMEKIRATQPELYSDFLLFLTRKICAKFRRLAGEASPVAAYADSIAGRRTSKYAEARPLPPSLVRSELWHLVHERMERISMELFNMSIALHEQIDAEESRELEERCMEALNLLADSMPELDRLLAGSEYEEMLWGYVFKEMYPYFMRSRHAERSYHKPKGYAGDFLMIEHIYGNTPKGAGRVGEVVDAFCLARPSSRAIRGRRKLLADQLARLSAPLAERDERIAIMNLACGPNRELFDFLHDCSYSHLVEALCIDIDSEALQYTNKHVNTFPHAASIRLMQENVIKWALGRSKQEMPRQNIIYSAGLCDYLDDRLFKRLITKCYHQLKPGGTLILGNLDYHDDAVFMDRILRWELIYRDKQQLRKLFADTPFGDATVLSEEEQINLFAVAVKE
jgi:CRP-like cAMP-binding protein/SAM-dependent methyltransferase